MTALDHYYTTTEAAELLGLSPPSVRDAVRRGRLHTERKGGRNLIVAEEVDRYRAEVLGTRGWQERKSPGHTRDEGAARRQRAYRERQRQ